MASQSLIARSAVAPRLRRPARSAQRDVTTAAIKLYANPRSRSKIVEWYLKELGVDYTTQPIDMAEKEHKSDWFMKVNPFGKVPAMEDGELQLFESGAMLMYLADKYGPDNTPEKRAEVSKWTLFANSTLGNALFLEQFRETQLPACMGPLEDILSKQDYLLGGELSAADVAVGAYLLYVPLMLPQVDLSGWPSVCAYMKRLQERPACMIQPAPATS